MSCAGCPLQEKGQGFSLPSGTGRNGVLLLAEALGAAEASSGVPFSGDAGWQLTKTLKRTQYHRDDFTIWNCCACRPVNNWLEGAPWEHEAVLHCDQYLRAVVQAKKPKVIMPLGNVAMRSVLGRRGVQELRGYVYEAVVHEHECLVVPTYHPSFILRGQDNLTGVQIYDIQRAVRVARDGYKTPEQRYIEHPTSEDLERFVEDAQSAAAAGAWLSIDIETPTTASTTEDEYGDIIDTDIICIGFSFRPHTGCTIRWTNAHLPVIQQLLQLPFAFSVFWNKDFDVPRILSKGLTIAAPPLDGMEAWHWLQSDLPRGLGFVSTFFTEMKEWKSMSAEQPEYYNCCDVDAALQNALGIQKVLQKEGRWDAFLHHVVGLDPILKTMGRAGVLVDQEKRAAFRARLQEELDEIDRKIQGAVPKAVRPFKPRRQVPPEAAIGELGGPAAEKAVWDYNDNGEWGLRKPFLYGSAKQLIAYMRAQKHPVPKNHKTQADTTGKEDLARLAKKYPKDPLYPLIVEARERQKMIGTYIDGYEPDVDGRVRTHFTFKPSTGRLASEHPNVQNIPKRNGISQPYREQFVPAPGYALVEFDYKACQAVIVGWLAKDPDYIKACRVGVHAVMASYVLTRQQKMLAPIDLARPEDAAHWVKWIKEREKHTYNNCKAVVHGSAFGGTPFKLKMDFPDSFPKLKDAEDMQKLYFGTVGRKIRQWQHDTLQLADKQCYLETPHKVRHYFWSVFVWDSRRREMAMGPAAKDALAFQPQAIERCVQTDAIQRIAARGERWVKVLRWPIHDSVLCEIHKDALGDMVPAIREDMTAPVKELDGLRFEVDVAWSDQSWANMIEWEGTK